MNRSRLVSLLAVLLLLSIALNAWLLLRPAAPPEVLAATDRIVRTAGSRSRSGAASGKADGNTDNSAPEPEKIKADLKTRRTEKDLAALPEDELIFGATKWTNAPAGGEPLRRVTPERIKALAAAEPSKAAKFRIHAVLHLPGDRVADFGSSDIEPGSLMKFGREREVPFPSSIQMADATPQSGSSFPITPATPGNFEFRNTGITIEVDVTPAAGTLVLGGQVTHRALEGFGRMPGEVFSPVYTRGVSDSGSTVDVILTENKVLQPQFSVSESPFLAAATAGQPCRVPVRMAFGQSILELTCTPVE